MNTGIIPFPFQPTVTDQSLQGLAPPPPTNIITPQIMAEMIRLIPEDERGLLVNLEPHELFAVCQMRYNSGEFVLLRNDPEVILETINFLRGTPATQLLTTISQCSNRQDFLWLSEQHRDGYIAVAREAFVLQAKESGIKGLIKCRRCRSSNAMMTSKQLRSGDEPTTITVRCVDCGETWKQ